MSSCCIRTHICMLCEMRVISLELIIIYLEPLNEVQIGKVIATPPSRYSCMISFTQTCLYFFVSFHTWSVQREVVGEPVDMILAQSYSDVSDCVRLQRRLGSWRSWSISRLRVCESAADGSDTLGSGVGWNKCASAGKEAPCPFTICNYKESAE